MSHRRWALAGVVALVATSVPVALAAPASAAEVGCDELEDGVRQQTTTVSAPYRDLLVGRARQTGASTNGGPAPVDGRGVGVAVVDSGVDAGTGLLRVERGYAVPGAGRLNNGHGTLVAGLIGGASRGGTAGGATGWAPGATIVPVKVTRTNADGVDEGVVRTDDLVVALEWVADNLRARDIEVVNLSLTVTDRTPALDRVVRRLQRSAVVVAATGNRPAPEAGSDGTAQDAYEAGEDVRTYPAHYTYPAVVGVSAVAPEGQDTAASVYASSGIDVTAPTFGAATVALGGSTCTLREVATSWSTAEVSGLAALLRQAYPRDTPAQTAARITRTATGALGGGTAERGPFSGAGVVQPLEALRQPLRLDRSGAPVGTSQVGALDDAPAEVAAPPADPLARSREQFLWWGVFAGGGLLVCLLARPLFARLRRR